MSLNGAGGRQEDAGGESEVTETLQHKVEAFGQSQLGWQDLNNFSKLSSDSDTDCLSVLTLTSRVNCTLRTKLHRRNSKSARQRNISSLLKTVDIS